MSRQYDSYLKQHRDNVKKGYTWLATNLPECLDDIAAFNIDLHDASKDEIAEYDAYDNYFYGNQKTPDVIEAFNYAWLHHIHCNPHHWQYWVLINDEPNEGETVLEMPYHYILEMIYDWWAFSWSKGDLTEIFSWYDSHKKYIKLHNNTRSIVEEILGLIKDKLEENDYAENQ